VGKVSGVSGLNPVPNSPLGSIGGPVLRVVRTFFSTYAVPTSAISASILPGSCDIDKKQL